MPIRPENRNLSPDDLALRFDPAQRALWHLELLGCYSPEEAHLPGPFEDEADLACFDYDEGDDEFACTHCGGEAYREVDDTWWDECDQYGWGPCTSCRGTGLRSHQWVF